MEDLNLWADIDFIQKINVEKNIMNSKFSRSIDKKIKENKKLSKIKKLGFDLIVYHNKKIGFINHRKTINSLGSQDFYFLDLDKNGGFEINPDNPLSEEDYKNLTEILELN